MSEDSPTPRTRIRVAALIVREGQILLAEHEKEGKRYWLLPGGGMEFGESIEETLKRELREEAGLEIEVGDLLWTLDSIPPDLHRHVLNLILEAKAMSMELSPGPDRVLRDVRWLPVEELPRIALRPDTREEIVRYIETGRIDKRVLGKRWR